jgi:hypothetical protein
VYIDKNETCHQDNSLNKKTVIACWRGSYFFKIIADPSFEFRMEGMWDIGKLWS